MPSGTLDGMEKIPITKVHENRLRREATRWGYKLVRDGDLFDIISPEGERVFVGPDDKSPSLTAEEVSDSLASHRDAVAITDEHDPTPPEKVVENRLRRMATRQGLVLSKSRRRDVRAYDYGTYALIDPDTNSLVAGDQNSGYGLSLSDVEAALTS